MSTSARTHPSQALPIYTAWLARLFVVACVVAGLSFFMFNDAEGHEIAAVILLAAAVLVAAGLFAFGRTSAWLAVALVTLGALAGGGVLVWTLVMPIAALALIVLFARNGLRGSSIADVPEG
jgi:hypothetical protein